MKARGSRPICSVDKIVLKKCVSGFMSGQRHDTEADQAGGYGPQRYAAPGETFDGYDMDYSVQGLGFKQDFRLRLN